MAETKMTSTNTVWIQAIAGGVSMLIPARKYPAWLRHTLTWGSTVGIFTLMAVPGVASKLQELTPGKAAYEEAGAGKSDVEPLDNNPVMRIGLAAAVGAGTYGLWRFSFWFDGAAERGLRNLRVPYPRVVMGIAVGGLYWVTEKLDGKYEARAEQSLQAGQR